MSLPGGYAVGDKVFWTGMNQTFSSGDQTVHGQQGEVVGVATLEAYKGEAVAVRFPGNKINVECYLGTVGRTPTQATRSWRSRDSLCPLCMSNRSLPGRGRDGGRGRC